MLGERRILRIVTGLSASVIGELSGRSGIFLHELSPQAASLEDAFMELTRNSVEYHGAASPVRLAAAAGASPREDRN